MLTVPRFKRSPIDTSIYSQAMLWKKKPYRAIYDSLIENIRDLVKNETGYDPCAASQRRTRELVTSRQLFIHFVRRYTRLSQETTGAILGKDHSTVFHAEKCVNKFKEIENEYAELYDRIDGKIQLIIRN